MNWDKWETRVAAPAMVVLLLANLVSFFTTPGPSVINWIAIPTLSLLLVIVVIRQRQRAGDPPVTQRVWILLGLALAIALALGVVGAQHLSVTPASDNKPEVSADCPGCSGEGKSVFGGKAAQREVEQSVVRFLDAYNAKDSRKLQLLSCGEMAVRLDGEQDPPLFAVAASAKPAPAGTSSTATPPQPTDPTNPIDPKDAAFEIRGKTSASDFSFTHVQDGRLAWTYALVRANSGSTETFNRVVSFTLTRNGDLWQTCSATIESQNFG